MADESKDETCDQTGETTEQVIFTGEAEKVLYTKGTDISVGGLLKENKVQESKRQEEPLQPVCEDVHAEGNSSSTNGNKPLAKKVLAAVGIGAAAFAVGVVAAPVVASAALGAAGFTASGVAAGSIAAAVQSAVYGGSVAAGSLFALAQSAGATGAIGAAATAAIGGGTGLAGAAATLGAFKFLDNEKSSDTIKLLICGSDDGALAFAGIASSLKGTDVRVLSLHEDEAERWSAAVQRESLNVTVHEKEKAPTRIVSKPKLITKNPENAMRGVDIVVLMLQECTRHVYLEALKPYILPGTIIVGLPGDRGFHFQVTHMLGDTGRQFTVLNFESLPWACLTTKFGVKCEVLGIMKTLPGTIKKGDVPPKKDPVATLQYLLGPLPKLMVSDSP